MKRRCVCSAEVSPWNWARHRRGDQCSARPVPCPETCAECGETWPCDVHEIGPLVVHHGAKRVAQAIGLPVRSVMRAWRRWRLQRFGPKRIRTRAQADRWRHLPSVELALARSRARLT
ncbi:MAG: hypothetical protein JST00_46800 [Deltaproteobacteria bacterium]|nr:hypothetical protein [Deltaproteobacteria bacterium]